MTKLAYIEFLSLTPDADSRKIKVDVRAALKENFPNRVQWKKIYAYLKSNYLEFTLPEQQWKIFLTNFNQDTPQGANEIVMAILFWMHQHHENLRISEEIQKHANEICVNLWGHSADEEYERRKLAGENWHVRYKPTIKAVDGGVEKNNFAIPFESTPYNSKDIASYPYIELILTTEESASELHYSQCLIDVLGRKNEQQKLRQFLEGDSGFKWFQLAGAGGQGKSRLAFELLRECDDSWNVGFLNQKNLQDFKLHWKQWHPSKPTLIIIDYILGRESDVKEALQILAKRCDSFIVPVRLLMVERSRWDRGGLVLQEKGPDRGTANFEIAPRSGGKAEWFLALCERSQDGNDKILADTRFEDGVMELENLNADDLVTITRQVARKNNHEITFSDETIKDHLARIDQSGRPLYAYFLGQSIASDRFQKGWNRDDLLDDVLLRD